MANPIDVAIVGGGPAGSALAIGLARLGYATSIFERHATPRWRACGVFASPLVRKQLADLDFTNAEIDALNQPIAVMELESIKGTKCRLEYRHGLACGFDRIALDEVLLRRAQAAGADVRRGAVVRAVRLDAGRRRAEVDISRLGVGEPETVSARVVVGADGGGSRVARAAAVTTGRNWLRRAGVTFHVADERDHVERATGRFLFGGGWYVGLAPVPSNRRNVGIVVPAERLKGGVLNVVRDVLGDNVKPLDDPQVAGRLEHHTARAAGGGWLLVGDAIEFIDPLTGEGLRRAFATASLGTTAVHNWLSGDRNAMAGYDRQVRSRFRSKNVFSLVLQAFIADARVFDYALRRLDQRTSLRDELTAVLADQRAATHALDPRFMARLLAP